MSEKITLKYDPVITVAVSDFPRTAKPWKNERVKLSDLYRRLGDPKRTRETFAQYMNWKENDKAKADDAKDCGAFLGGSLNGPVKEGKAIESRTLLTLDIDSAIPFFGLGDGVSWCRYTTHTHEPGKSGRFRIVSPLSRPVTAAEYPILAGHIAREIGEELGLDPADIFTDPTTFRPEQCCYWPSISRDGEFLWDYNDGEKPLDVDGILDTDKKPYIPKERAAATAPGTEAKPEAIHAGKVPQGSRWEHLHKRLGDLVNGLGKKSDPEKLVQYLWDIAHEECEGTIDNEDFGLFRKKYLRAAKNYHQRLIRDPMDAKEARAKYFLLHPEAADLPKKAGGEKPDWQKIKTEVLIAEETGKLKPEPEPPAKKPASVLQRIKKLSDVKEEQVEWLIDGYIPVGEVALLAGDGGAGKTSIWNAIVATITTGHRSIFDMALNTPEEFIQNRESKTVLFFSFEDSTSKVLRERIRKAGANMENTLFYDVDNEDDDVDPEDNNIYFDSPKLEEIIKELRPALVVFDPIQSFIPPTVTMAARNEMRKCVGNLVRLAHKYETAFLILAHSNKKINVAGRSRISDSSDLWDISRSVLIVGNTSEPDERYLSQEKSNYGKLSPTIIFTVSDEGVKFKEITSKRDRDFMAESSHAPRNAFAQEEAKELILDYLKEGEKQAADLDKHLREAGVSFATTKRAKKALKDEQKIAYRTEGYGEGKKWFIGLTETLSS